VSALDLRGTDLVVLSACDTGLGAIEEGEGVLGLQRAFQEAGARALMSSLWKVNDNATTVLMDEFYTNLWKKKLSKGEALRQAQLTLLREPERLKKRRTAPEPAPADGAVKRSSVRDKTPAKLGERTDPGLWAAFILSGDWR
jgi:CHAT domain-containing protein